MIELLAIGFLAGLIAGISPCILPVLPIVFAGWTSGPVEGERVMVRRRRRAVAVVAGLVLSFSAITLVGTAVLSSLGLSLNFLHYAGIVVLLILGLALIVPALEKIVERPFVRLTGRTPSGNGSGFVLGLGLGAVFVPCAGPVLTAVSVLGTTKHVGVTAVFLTLLFALGAAIPLLVIALAGDQVIERNRSLRHRAKQLRPLGGALLIVMALGILFNWFQGVQTWLPGYTTSLQHTIESNSFATSQLRALRGDSGAGGSIAKCVNASYDYNGNASLLSCGSAPNFTGISTWLNTPMGHSISVSQLRGHVVLVDFWTYSCINCQRTLPHVEAWYHRYHAYGLDVIGVHSPEFAFEHVASNIATADQQLGVHYPVAVDNDLATWTAYDVQGWPAEYLVDANGTVRHNDVGEGSYDQTESFIRTLLLAAHPGVALPPPTNVADLTPTVAQSPETYLGYERSQYLVGSVHADDQSASYSFPNTLPEGYYGLSGTWNVGAQAATAVSDSQLELNFLASHVYLVMGGAGTLTYNFHGVHKVVTISGVPRLYQLVNSASSTTGIIDFHFSRGVAAYDFTFG